MNKIIDMFISFFKIGAFTFGGGYAMIPLIESEVVTKKGWLSKQEFIDVLVVSQSLPGALAVNCCTFLGYKIGGVIGAIIALFAVVIPSFLIIVFIAIFFMQFRNNYYVNAVFKGITAAVPILILSGAISLTKSLQRSIRNLIIICISLIILIYLKLSPILVIIFGGIYGAIFLREKVK